MQAIEVKSCEHHGHVQTASNYFVSGNKVSTYSLDRKQQKQQSSKHRHFV